MIVSGSESPRDSDTWYSRLQAATELSRSPAPPQPVNADDRERTVSDFRPPPLAVGVRSAPAFESDLMRVGRAWHALLERGSGINAEQLARAYGLDEEQIATVVAAAERVRSRLPHLFSAQAHAELDIVSANGELMRIDRIVEHDGSIWIVDFKWQVTDGERAAYELQIRRYAETVRAIRQDIAVRTGFVTADGLLIEVSESGVEAG